MSTQTVSDFRRSAKRKLPRFLFEYLDGGAFSEATLRANERDFNSVKMRQQVLASHPYADLSCDYFGKTYALPIALAPVGIAGLYARRGEAQAARAAMTANIPFCLSTVGVCSAKEVCDASDTPLWFQLYMTKDRRLTEKLLEQAAQTKADVLIVTVDMPIPAPRYRDVRSGLATQNKITDKLYRLTQIARAPSWAVDVGLRGRPHTLGNLAPHLGERAELGKYWTWMSENFDPTIGWEEIQWLRDKWRGPLIIKGVLDPQDAARAHAMGADGVVVSNHGGRQLDGVPSSITALPAIAAEVGGGLKIFLDGGVRSGVDVIRALGLGADGVLIGRPWVYALASQGEAGVESLLKNFEHELRTALALAGCKTLSSVREAIITG